MRALLLIPFLTSIAYAQESVDIRTWAPVNPQGLKTQIALPQSGTTIEEIGGDWARRQIHLSTDGADERFIADTNEKLDRFFGLSNDRPQALDDDSLATQAARKPASESNVQSASWLQPRSLHMSKLGEFELAFGADTKLQCDLVNGSELTLSKPIFQDIDLRLHHENTFNSVQLKFDW